MAVFHRVAETGLLRTGRKDAIHILTEGEVTSNFVYLEVFDFGEDL